jgi:hypothetical protein
MSAHAFVKVVMAGSLAAAAVAWWMKDELPPPARLAPRAAGRARRVRPQRSPLDLPTGEIQ